MTAHADILDQPEPLRKSLAGSVILHISAVAALVATGTAIGPHKPELWGDTRGGGPGSVAVTAVSRVPLPARSGPVNPVANDTNSVIPEAPPKAKPRARATEPDPNAIALKSSNVLRKASPPASARNTWREKQQELPNQVYGTAGQAAVTSMIGRTGGGGVGLGNNSPFGGLYGNYANLLRDQVARRWQTGEIDPRIHSLPPVTVSFILRRDGSVPAASVKISQTSGNLALDLSAQRAILDAAPFPPLPVQFPRSQAEIDFVFQLRR